MRFALTILDGVRWYGSAVVGHRPRALLETLVASPPGCSSDVLIECIWGDAPPAKPTKALQVLVSRVRTATEPRAIERTAVGYRLGLGRDEVDVLAQADLLSSAHSAYGDGRFADALSAARGVLEIGASDDATAVLALASSKTGVHATALPMLEALASARPADEQVLAALMLSEAAVRGPSAALERYERYRSELADRLGSDPGEDVQHAYRAVLAADSPIRDGVRYAGTILLGRDDDLRALRTLMHEARVVSIVGPGGLGKTRLAHVLGHESEQPVVHFVELVGVTSPDDVIGEIGTVLGIRDSVTARRTLSAQRRADVRSRIAQSLDAAPSLLILDNCEHVVDAVADLVAFLVATTSDLRVVTTTRAPLEIAAERVYALGQLGVPDAVELFRQRALAARPSVVLADALITEIVTSLDGLPLAIELAAAKARVMSVDDIRRRLEDRFALLRGGDRSAPDRHQTLVAVIDWSWNLLAEPERHALRWLSVFHDGFSLAAAEAVLESPAMESVEELVRQSLLSVREDGPSVRYWMLETVREFGRMQLADAGEEPAAARAQRDWARAYASSASTDLMSPAQFTAVDALRAEEVNLADVLRQALAASDQDTVVGLLAGLAPFWTITGEHSRIVRLVPSVCDALDGWTPPAESLDDTRAALALMIINAGFLTPSQPVALRRLLEQIGPDSADPQVAATCKVTLAFDTEHPVRGPDRLNEFCDSDDRYVAIQGLQYRSQARENDGQPEAAIEDVTRALTLAKEEDGPWLFAFLHTLLAQLHGQLGRPDEAAEHALHALPVLDRIGATDDGIQCRLVLAVQAMDHNRFDDAAALVDEIERVDSLNPGFGSTAIIVMGRAELNLLRGETALGLEQYRAGIERSRSIRFPGTGLSTGLEPWVLFGESAGLAAHALYGGPGEGEDLWDLLRVKADAATVPDRAHLDYPVVGLMFFGLAIWGLRREAMAPEDAIELLVLADRFAYSQVVPTMRWENAAAPAERVAPGLLRQLQEKYGERRGSSLLGEARAVLARAFG